MGQHTKKVKDQCKTNWAVYDMPDIKNEEMTGVNRRTIAKWREKSKGKPDDWYKFREGIVHLATKKAQSQLADDIADHRVNHVKEALKLTNMFKGVLLNEWAPYLNSGGAQPKPSENAINTILKSISGANELIKMERSILGISSAGMLPDDPGGKPTDEPESVDALIKRLHEERGHTPTDNMLLPDGSPRAKVIQAEVVDENKVINIDKRASNG